MFYCYLVIINYSQMFEIKSYSIIAYIHTLHTILIKYKQ